MRDEASSRRRFLAATSLAAAGGLAGCSVPETGSSGGPSTPTTADVIESFDGRYTVGTYEQPDEQGSLEDLQYSGRGSFPILVTHDASVEYEIDLTVQEGYETIPLNIYFVDADNYLKLQQEAAYEVISAGTSEPVEEKEEFAFDVSPGLYFLVMGSATVGRESTFRLDFTARERLNVDRECADGPINVGHLSLAKEGSLFNVESWNVRYHIQYTGDADSEYKLELTLLSSDDETTLTQTQSQVGDCETNFVYADEETLNTVSSDTDIIADIAVLDSGGETLAETRQEIETVVR